jgi:hypothetical protein
MISPYDKEYKQTKQIMLGKKTMNPDFRPLADFIDRRFGVRTINIVYDTIDNGTRPRIGIYFEFSHEKQSFNENNGDVNFDSKKQKLIADKLRQTIIEQGLIKNRGLFNLLTKTETAKYQTDNIWVYYSAFEPIARNEANESIPQVKVMQLKTELNCKDLWEISRCFSGTTFFLYTDEQVKQYENSETRKMWADKYFDLLEPYNEFDYFERDKFNVFLDSKENFDNNYKSNWYYYYK